MTQRERFLACLIGLLILFSIGFYVVSRVSNAITQRQNRKRAAESELDRQERTIQLGSRATRQLAQLRERSLPADRETAQSLYQRWLLNLVDEVGITNPSVDVGDRRLGGLYFNRISFQIDGEATLEQAVHFFHRFYSSNDLHRIQEFSLKPFPNRDSNELDFSATIEAMILPGNKRQTVGDLASNRMTDGIDAYQKAILGRNLFAPPNSPPSIRPIANKRTARGQQFTVRVSADDDDEADKLTYRLVGYAPDGAAINAETGKIDWLPDKNDEYEFTVQVSDDGTPSLSDEATFRVTVTDPPKDDVADDDDEDRFDEAEFAYLVGTVSTGPKREIWVSIRTTGKLLRLSAGDALNVGTVKGVVKEIGDRHASIRTDAGELRVRVGQNLRQGQISKPPQQAAAS